MSKKKRGEDSKTLQETLSELRQKRDQLLGKLDLLRDSLQGSAESLRGSLEETASSVKQLFRVYVWAVRGFWVLFCAALMFISYSFGALLTYGPAILVVALLGVAVNELYIRSKRPIALDYTTSSAQQSVSIFSLLRGIAGLVTAGLKQVSVTLALLSPTAEQLTKIEDLWTKQQRTLDSIWLMLRRYNFRDSATLASSLQRYSSFSVNEDIWVVDLIQIVARITGADSTILKLAYYDSMNQTTDVDKIWLTIKDNPQVLGELSILLTRNNLIGSTAETPQALAVLSKLLYGLPSYSLESAKLRANTFFVDLATFRVDCIGHLRNYRLTFTAREREVEEFYPLSYNPDEWRGEVVAVAAKILEVDVDFVSLLIGESMGDYTTRVEAWKSIVRVAKFSELATMLVKHGIVRAGQGMEDEVTIRRLALVLQAIKGVFSLRDVAVDLSRLEADIQRVRRNILQCASFYRLVVDGATFGLDFVPSDTSTVEESFVESAAAALKVDPLIFRLLYAKVKPEGYEEAASLYGEIRKCGKLEQFGSFLLSHGLVRDVPFSENLPLLLSFYETFDLQEISDAFNYYDRLSSLSRNLVVFLLENNLGNRLLDLKFEELAKICPPHKRMEYVDGVVHLLSVLISTVPDLRGSDLVAQRFELAKAGATLFLWLQRDQGATRLCMQVAYLPLAPKILYEYAKLSDESGLSQIRPTLRTALAEAQKPSIKDRHFEYFVNELLVGRLYVNVSSLLSRQVSEIRDLLEAYGKEGFESAKLAEDLREAIRDVMEKEIDNDTVGDLLLRQVLTAYIITVPGMEPVISALDDYLEAAAADLAKERNDPILSKLIMKAKGTGSWTRVGLVPYGMTFEEFTRRFESVAERAIEMYRRDNPGSAYRLTHYVIRIYPSADALKVVAQDPSRNISPLTVVRKLIREQMPGVDGLQVMTVAQTTGTSRVKLRTVFASILDSDKCSLMQLLGDTVAPLIAKDKTLKNVLINRIIEKALLAEYGVNRLSELATLVAKLERVDGGAAVESLGKKVSKALPSGHALDQDETKLLSSLVYMSLRRFGIVLTA